MKVTSVIGLLVLSGCATFTNRFGTATMEADPTEIGAESIILQNELSLAYTNVPPTPYQGSNPNICRFTKPSFQEQNKHAYARHTEQNGRKTGADKFSCLYLRENPAEAERRNYMLAGLALSDLYCDTYFRRIARRWNERLFLRNTTNDVGAAISAVLGLAKAGSGVTGGVGAGFGLADSAFRNYDSVFVVAPDLHVVQGAVKKAQDELRSLYETKTPPDYYTAQSIIITYANLCSYTGMKGLLNRAIDLTINDRTGASFIGASAIDGATAASEQARKIEEKKAANTAAELEAYKKRKADEDELKKLQANESQPTDPAAPPDPADQSPQ